ncbi:protein FAM90A27P-like [Elephas maximus indicus]|uniref:protein FAM90A27P-like n=1 Tax=Elephas maximus indicus TaxID=99487 RepID=UPI00211600EC|nr:protein FAM90A27P-like [Elephas maximus indicus]
MEPKKPQEPQTLWPFNNLEREKEQRQRQGEHDRKAPLQKFPERPEGKQQQNWKESTESCDYLRHPCRPMPIHTTTMRSVLDPSLRNWPHVRKPDLKSIFPERSPIQDHDPSFFSCHGQTKEEEVGITGSSQPATKHFGQDCTLMAKTADNRCDACAHYVSRPATKTLALGHVLSPQAQAKGPDRISKSSPQPARGRRGQDSPLRIQAPGTRSVQTPVQICLNPAKKAKLTTLQILQQSSQRPDVGAGQPLSSTTEFGPKGPPQVTRMTVLQPPHSTPQLNTVEISPILPPPISSHVP